MEGREYKEGELRFMVGDTVQFNSRMKRLVSCRWTEDANGKLECFPRTQAELDADS